MTTATQSIRFDASGFQSFLDSCQDPQWLKQIRRSAWERFEVLPWPSSKDEEWMRTDIRLFKLDKFSMPSEPKNNIPSAVLNEGVDLAGHCAAQDGISIASELDPDIAAKGVLFGNIRQLLAEHGNKLRPYFHNAFDPSFDRFAALHAAFWSSGTVLYVPRNVVIEKPLHALAAMSDGGIDFGHMLVILDEGAEATLLTEWFCAY